MTGCALHPREARDDCPRCHGQRGRLPARITAREAELQAAAARARRTPAWAAHIAGTLVLGGGW